MDTLAIDRASDFIYKNARLIDRLLFAHLFDGAAKEPVLAALRAYQNVDGGFGNALEPDKRVPASQPQDVEVALRIMDMLGVVNQAITQRACDFLETVTTEAGGVPFSLPSVNAYPHAPWWASAENPPAALNPTAAIAGLLLKHGVTHPWLERALAFCWREIAATDTAEFHDLIPAILFLEHVPDRDRADRELTKIGARILGSGNVALDASAEGYVHPPLDWAPLPCGFGRTLFVDDVLRDGLRALAAAQQPDGGWPISWVPISPGVELEWRGHVTVGALVKLRAYAADGL